VWFFDPEKAGRRQRKIAEKRISRCRKAEHRDGHVPEEEVKTDTWSQGKGEVRLVKQSKR
jgi:hypothetical protein